jgi:hypothetical protein
MLKESIGSVCGEYNTVQKADITISIMAPEFAWHRTVVDAPTGYGALEMSEHTVNQ